MILLPVRQEAKGKDLIGPIPGAAFDGSQPRPGAPRRMAVQSIWTLLEAGMQAQVSILHHDYPVRAREQVEQKLQHLVKFYDRIVSMRALLERQHDEHRVEIVAHVARGAVLVVDARGSAFSVALEEAIERMERLLKKQNDKRMHQRRRGRTTP